MFGIRTPIKPGTAENKECPEHTANTKVRRSIGEWESGKPEARESPTTPENRTPPVVGNIDQKRKATAAKNLHKASSSARVEPTTQSPPTPKVFGSRIEEARACLNKAKEQLHLSRNLKTEIKLQLIAAIERLYNLVKESEAEAKGQPHLPTHEPAVSVPPPAAPVRVDVGGELMRKIEAHSVLLKENGEKLDKLQATIEGQAVGATYASVAASQSRAPREGTALHSLMVASTDEMETGEEVLERIRKAVDAKEGGIDVERIRKVKDRRVVMGCRTEDDRDRLRERIARAGKHLTVEDMKNKDPMLVLKDVLTVNTDEDILKALRNQNREVFHDLGGEDSRVEVKYRRRARNPLTGHVVVCVTPVLWQRLTARGYAYIDLQRIRVEDQTPLVQCTRCLGYGHGRRFCKEAADSCSHCGGSHLRAECPDWQAGQPPSCRNCKAAGQSRADHNAFSASCPVRMKWDGLARASVAYC